MIFDGALFAVLSGVLVGMTAYKTAEMNGSREAFLEWSFAAVIFVTWLLAVQLDLESDAILATLTESPLTIGLAVLGAVGLGAACGFYARWSLKLNLTPAKVGLIFFAVTVLIWIVFYIVVRVKEPT